MNWLSSTTALAPPPSSVGSFFSRSFQTVPQSEIPDGLQNLDQLISGGSMLGPGGTPPNLAQAPQINSGQLDTVVLLLVDVIGSTVISLSRCCLPNDEGPAPPPIFFLEPPL